MTSVNMASSYTASVGAFKLVGATSKYGPTTASAMVEGVRILIYEGVRPILYRDFCTKFLHTAMILGGKEIVNPLMLLT